MEDAKRALQEEEDRRRAIAKEAKAGREAHKKEMRRRKKVCGDRSVDRSIHLARRGAVQWRSLRLGCCRGDVKMRRLGWAWSMSPSVVFVLGEHVSCPLVTPTARCCAPPQLR